MGASVSTTLAWLAKSIVAGMLAGMMMAMFAMIVAARQATASGRRRAQSQPHCSGRATSARASRSVRSLAAWPYT